MSPEDLVGVAKSYNTLGIAFTYTEPLMWFEYLLDVAPLLREAGQKVVLVSNGFINPEPLDELLPYIDAANIDLKSMDQDFYRKVCKAKLDPVKDTIIKMHEAGVHLEITNLVIPELNDSESDIEELVDFVAGLSEYIPLHFSAYYPSYKLNKPPTPPSKLQEVREIALKKLKYVFLGNVRLTEGADSNCPQCGNKLVERSGYAVKIQGLDGSKCRACGFNSYIIR
jgi:pyruvate formate lyase activating enzyme